MVRYRSSIKNSGHDLKTSDAFAFLPHVRENHRGAFGARLCGRVCGVDCVDILGYHLVFL